MVPRNVDSIVWVNLWTYVTHPWAGPKHLQNCLGFGELKATIESKVSWDGNRVAAAGRCPAWDDEGVLRVKLRFTQLIAIKSQALKV